MKVTVDIPRPIEKMTTEAGYSEEETVTIFSAYLKSMFNELDLLNANFDFEIWLDDEENINEILSKKI